MSYTRCRVLSGALLAFTLLTSAGAASAAAAPALFGRLAAPIAVQPDGPGVLRGEPVTVDARMLLNSTYPGLSDGRITLNFFSDAHFTAVLDRVAFETPTTLSWIGRVEGIEGSSATFVSGGGIVVGTVTVPGATFRLRYSPERVHVVEQVDANAFPLETLPIEVPNRPRLAATGTGSRAVTDDGSTFDLLVVYNAAARQAAGGTTAMQNLITLGVTETNQAYANSGIIPRLRLVRMEEISYNEVSSISTTLSRLRSTTDGRMDQVHTLRNTYGADLVKFVGNSTSGGCGVAYLMNGSNNTGFASSAFSVTARVCISPNYTFGHELGHNMGSNHAPDDPTGTGAFNYSFGYKDPNDVFRTVMAYDCSPSCPRVLHFSNPSVSYQGRVTGTSTQNNATSINNVRSVVANFRQATQ
jgi:peptidyl-Asp metalloendopeptidase